MTEIFISQPRVEITHNMHRCEATDPIVGHPETGTTNPRTGTGIGRRTAPPRRCPEELAQVRAPHQGTHLPGQ